MEFSEVGPFSSRVLEKEWLVIEKLRPLLMIPALELDEDPGT